MDVFGVNMFLGPPAVVEECSMLICNCFLCCVVCGCKPFNTDNVLLLEDCVSVPCCCFKRVDTFCWRDAIISATLALPGNGWTVTNFAPGDLPIDPAMVALGTCVLSNGEMETDREGLGEEWYVGNGLAVTLLPDNVIEDKFVWPEVVPIRELGNDVVNDDDDDCPLICCKCCKVDNAATRVLGEFVNGDAVAVTIPPNGEEEYVGPLSFNNGVNISLVVVVDGIGVEGFDKCVLSCDGDGGIIVVERADISAISKIIIY